MRQNVLDDIDKILKEIVQKHLTNRSINVFDEFVKSCQTYYDRPVGTMYELKRKANTKIKGDVFEHWCLLYLRHCWNLKEVWLLKDAKNMINLFSIVRHELMLGLI